MNSFQNRNGQTDFVAKDENFAGFSAKVAAAALAANETDAAKIAELKLEDGQTVEEARIALVQKIGENTQVRRATKSVWQFTSKRSALLPS